MLDLNPSVVKALLYVHRTMDLALMVTKAPQRAQAATATTTAARRAQAARASMQQMEITNGNRASSHVSRMRQLSRTASPEAAQVLLPVQGAGRQLSKGALGGGAAKNHVNMQQQGMQAQVAAVNQHEQQQQQQQGGNQMGVFVTKQQQQPLQQHMQGAIPDENAGQQQQLRIDSASSHGSNALSDTPSTSSILMMPIHDSKPKKMERASSWNASVENLFRLQQAGYTDFTAYLKFWADAEQIPVWEESGFIKSIKNNNGLFMYFRRTKECEDKYLNKVKIYHY